MKLKSLVLGALMALSTTSVFANAYVTVNSLQVTAEVVNNSYSPMVCSGRVYGQTSSGLILNAWFSQVIPAGGYRYAYVYTNLYGQFTNGWSDIVCNY